MELFMKFEWWTYIIFPWILFIELYIYLVKYGIIFVACGWAIILLGHLIYIPFALLFNI